MKKFIVILIITLLLLSLATYEVIKVNNIITKLNADVIQFSEKLELNKDDVSELYSDINTINDYWKDCECDLCLIFNHKDLSIITETLSRLLIYIKLDDYENSAMEISLLIAQCEKNPHIMGFNIHNLL